MSTTAMDQQVVDAAVWEEASSSDDSVLSLRSGFLKLTEVDTDVHFADHHDLWTPPGARGVFGGQTIAQAVHAAMRSVGPGYVVHSFHGYFLLAGDAGRNILFHVDRIRDGRSFATRRVEAKQKNKVIFSATLQFHVPEPSYGLEVADPMPPVPSWEGLKSDYQIMRELLEDPTSAVPDQMRQLFLKRINGPQRIERRQVPKEEADVLEPVHWYWTRSPLKLDDDPSTHKVCLAYLSDMGMITAAYGPFGGWEQNRPNMVVSLDHSMWFHSENFRADEWLLFETRCHRAAGARILSLCKVWSSTTKELVFSCTQEGLARHSETKPLTRVAPEAKL
mmetsp:Transcript_13023/g.32569  ORF Transcript_13023/g.32569 Transcript_13023/m.32569 type:complete len:335 (+) Transcript_13023:23-1027(+)